MVSAGSGIALSSSAIVASSGVKRCCRIRSSTPEAVAGLDDLVQMALQAPVERFRLRHLHLGNSHTLRLMGRSTLIRVADEAC